MSSERAQWEDVKDNYLRLIQQSLASLNHPRRFEILGNVEEHLENKYAELPKDKRTWESYQQIITEMGPPAEYAALLCDDIRHAHRNRPNWASLLAGAFVVALFAVGAYLIIKTGTEQPKPSIPVNQALPGKTHFEELLDKTVSVDIEHGPNNTKLSVQYAVAAVCQADGIPYQWDESASRTDPERRNYIEPLHFKDVPAKVILDDILKPLRLSYALDSNGLHLCWPQSTPDNNLPSSILQQNSPVQQTQHAEPNASALTDSNQFQGAADANQPDIGQKDSTPPSYATVPTIFGKWIAVDYVPRTDDFVPDQRQYKKPMILKAMDFIEPSTVYWSFSNNVLKQTSFGEAAIETINGYSARYTMKTLEGQDYLFVTF